MMRRAAEYVIARRATQRAGWEALKPGGLSEKGRGARLHLADHWITGLT